MVIYSHDIAQSFHIADLIVRNSFPHHLRLRFIEDNLKLEDLLFFSNSQFAVLTYLLTVQISTQRYLGVSNF